MKRISDFLLRGFVAASMAPASVKRRGRLLAFVFMASMMAMPALAQTASATDNVITRFVWYLAQIAFYGVGGAIVLFGIIIPVGKKVLGGQRMEVNPVVNILWAVAFFAAPAVLKMFLTWFSADTGSEGLLDDMDINLGIGGGTGP